MIEPKIIRSRRKYLTIIIDKDKNLIVRAPLRTSNKEIFDFIARKQNWITKKLNEQKSTIKPLTVLDGEKLPILGKIYTIKLTSSLNKVYVVDDNIFIPLKDSKQKLINYFKNLAKAYLTKRVEELAKQNNFKYKTIRISSAHTNWGSCSYRNSLNFTYKLMLCPVSVIDYIIIHELCHTLIKNHSVNFYNLVYSIMPNYKEYTKWLKTNASIINLI